MIGTAARSGREVRVRPYASASEEGRMAGSIARGIPKMSSNSSSQSSVSRFISIVRLALVTSVAWIPPSGPPVRFHNTQQSVFPNTACPCSAAARTPSTFSRIHLIFPPEK